MIIKTDRYRHRYTVGEMYRVLLAVISSIGSSNGTVRMKSSMPSSSSA